MSAGKKAILESARQLFSTYGFRGTTMRMIAADAGCDVALLAYHFGNKQQLFVEALDPKGLTESVRELLQTVPLDSIAETVLRHLVSSWETPEGAQVLAGIRAIIENSGDQIKPLGMKIWGTLAERLNAEGIDRAEERVELMMATIIGASTMRKFAHGSRLSTVSHEEFVAFFAPTMHRYLSGSLFV